MLDSTCPNHLSSSIREAQSTKGCLVSIFAYLGGEMHADVVCNMFCEAVLVVTLHSSLEPWILVFWGRSQPISAMQSDRVHNLLSYGTDAWVRNWGMAGWKYTDQYLSLSGDDSYTGKAENYYY